MHKLNKITNNEEIHKQLIPEREYNIDIIPDFPSFFKVDSKN